MNDNFLQQEVTISDEVLFQEIEGECVLLNLKTEEYFGLDEVGTRVWNLLNEDGKTAYTIESLRKEYDVDSDVLEKDVAALLNELQKQGLITIVN